MCFGSFSFCVFDAISEILLIGLMGHDDYVLSVGFQYDFELMLYVSLSFISFMVLNTKLSFRWLLADELWKNGLVCFKCAVFVTVTFLHFLIISLSNDWAWIWIFFFFI
jgi:hypothetical protein